jgi:hypothetical protein
MIKHRENVHGDNNLNLEEVNVNQHNKMSGLQLQMKMRS